jgi:bilirubin oxidase
VAPAKRFDVVVTFRGAACHTLALTSSHLDRGMGEPVEPDRVVLQILLEDAPSDPAVDGALPVASIEPLVTDAATPVRSVVLGCDPEPLAGDAPAFTINGERWPFAPELKGDLATIEIWSIVNDTPTPEPFHVHGTFFQVIDRDGVPEPRRALEDVALVAAGTTLRLAVRFEQPGKWMFHSHIPEHAERGMMGVFDVR